MSKDGYWDDFRRGGQGGKNLKVDFPFFHKLIKPEQAGNDYWAWIRYNSAQLNLSKFERGKSTLFQTFKKDDMCAD